jgi:hypothetical protein
MTANPAPYSVQPPGRPQKRKEIQMSNTDMIRTDLPLSPDEMDLEAVERELAAYDPAAASALEKSDEYMARRVQLWRRFDVLTRLGAVVQPHGERERHQ